MKNKSTKPKYIVYACVFVGQIIVIQIISAITGVGTENTWLAAIGVNALMATIVILLFDMLRSLKGTKPKLHPFIKFMLPFSSVTASIKFFIIFIIAISVIINVLFLYDSVGR